MRAVRSSSSTSPAAADSLLQTTIDRLEPLADERIVVVTGVAHASAVRAQLPGLGAERVLAEPSPRDSMAAIGLAAAVLERRDPDAVIGSFAADHVIPDRRRPSSAVIREAAAVARRGELVTIGIEPTRAATGFGYIRLGSALVERAPTARRVADFVEKPDEATRPRTSPPVKFRWNAGMFVVGHDAARPAAEEQPEMAVPADDRRRRVAACGTCGRGCARSPSTTPSQSPRPDAGRVWSCPRPGVGRHRRLREPGVRLLLGSGGEGDLRVLGDPADVTVIDGGAW